MKIYEEKPLSQFDFWSGAATNVADFELTEEQFDAIEVQLEELYPDGMEDTQINDLFWFDFKWVMELIGLTDEEGVEKWWNDLEDESKHKCADLCPDDYISMEAVDESNEWWDELKDSDKIEHANINVEDYIPAKKPANADYEELWDKAFEAAVIEANEWWNDLVEEDKVDFCGYEISEDGSNPYLDEASDECTEAADEWWSDLNLSEKLECYKENQ